MAEKNWIRLGAVSEFDQTDSHMVDANGENVLLVNREDQWCAFSLKCPHKGGDMRKIDLKDNILACPLHGWLFDISDGGRELHEYGDLPEHLIHVEGGSLFLEF